MVTIRCTQKLLRRVPIAESTEPSTTLLGDWYANVLFTRPQQLVLCVSERTVLSVVVPARPARDLGTHLVASLGPLLLSLGVSSERIAAEQSEMRSVRFGRTQNRRVLGTMNDLMFQLSWYLHDNPTLSLLEASLKLAQTPCSVIGGFPDRLTQSLFEVVGEPC